MEYHSNACMIAAPTSLGLISGRQTDSELASSRPTSIASFSLSASPSQCGPGTGLSSEQTDAMTGPYIKASEHGEAGDAGARRWLGVVRTLEP